MRSEMDRLAPEEGCGLAVGRDDRVLEIIHVTNILHSPIRYRMAPHEQLEAFEKMDRQGWVLIAIFHSHPSGPPVPSLTDVAEAYYPEAVYLIWSREKGEWECRGFFIQEERVDEVPVTVEG